MIDKLKQIRFINGEISAIESQISNLRPITSVDKVNGSCSSFPYTAMSLRIEGVDIEDYNRRTKRLRSRLVKKKNELLSLQVEVQNFIDGIEDSLTRQVIINRYVNGYSWIKVAEVIGGDNTPDGVRMLAKRFIDNL